MSTRRSFLKLSLSGATLLAVGSTVRGLAEPRLRSSTAPPAADFSAIRRNVGYFTDRGGTIGYLASDEALVVIDTQNPESAEACWMGLHDRTGRAIDAVINTHHHGDHTGGNVTMDEHTKRIIAHRNVPMLQRQAAQSDAEADAQVYANETFDSTYRFSVGDETLLLRHYGPAHTSGDILVLFEEANVAHVGDLVFNRLPPFIDVYGGGADSQNWIAVLETIHRDLDDETQVLFGHGNPSFGVTGTRADLLVMRDFLAALRDYVSEQRAAGQSAEDMAVQRLPGFEDFYAGEGGFLSIPNCIDAVYQEQTGG